MNRGTTVRALINALVAAAIAVVVSVVIYSLTAGTVPGGFVVTIGVVTALVTFTIFLVISELAKRRR